MRFKMIIEYDGANYCGWQEQEGLPTIQGKISNAFKKFNGQNIIVVGSGRTDAGVSAKSQVAHFDLETNLSTYNLKMALNRNLPDDIRIKDIQPTKDDFHARFDAKRKTYSYRMYANAVESPLRRKTHLQVWHNLDFDSMQKACSYFVGTHDFKGFCQDNPQITNTIRTIFDCKMTKIDDDITITITGDGFLHNMVRIICGTILKIGQRKIKLADLPSIIESKDRQRAGQTLGAVGLTLESVEY